MPTITVGYACTNETITTQTLTCDWSLVPWPLAVQVISAEHLLLN
jgi:hypothetical protein